MRPPHRVTPASRPRIAIGFGAIALAGGSAFAEPRVRLDARGECQVQTAAEHAARYLGRDPFDGAAPDVIRIRTNVGPDGASAELTVEAEGRIFGPRIVAAADCEHLLSTLAVVIATAVTSLPVASVAPPIASQVAEPTITVGSAPTTIAGHRQLAFDVVAGISGGLDREGPRAGADAGVRVRMARGAIDVLLELAAPSDRLLANSTSQVTTSIVGLSVRPCTPIGPISACAIVSAGEVFGRASSVLVSDPGTLPFADVGVGVGYEHALTPNLSIRTRADLRVNVLTARFEVDQMPVWSNPRFEGWLGLDAIAHIP